MPKGALGVLNLSTGDKVRVIIEDQKIVLEPIKKRAKAFHIQELVKRIPDDYTPGEVFDEAIGHEVW